MTTGEPSIAKSIAREKICLLRATDFRGKLYQRHYDHNVIAVCKHKDDSFVDILDLQQFISGNFSMILNHIHLRCLSTDLWNMGHKQSAHATIYNKYFQTVNHIFQVLGQRTLKPTYVLTDDDKIAELVSGIVPFYTKYPGMQLCQPKLGRTIEGLCLEKPIDIRNPLHRLHLSGFFKKRKTLKFPIKQFLKDIPEQYILFFALGTYRKDYNYPTVISALYTLIKHAKHNLTHKVFIALGGNFNDFNIQDEEYYHMLLSSTRADLERFNLLFVDRISTTDKKALLRRSNAMIYLNTNPGYNPDLRLSLSVGCPIITLKAGYAEHVIVHGFSGFHLERMDSTKLAVYMYRLTHPLKREYHSECARNHYIKEHTLTLYTLDSFREEDTPRPPPIQPVQAKKGEDKGRKSQIEEPEVFKVPESPKVTVDIEPTKRVLLYKSLSTTTLYPEMEKKKIERKPSLPNIKIDTKKPKEKAKPKQVKAKPTSKLPTQKKPEKAVKPTKPKPRIIEEMDVTPRTRLLMKSKSTSKLNILPKTAPKPVPRPAPKVYKRKPEPPSAIRAVGAFALKREIPKEEPPKASTSKENLLKDNLPKAGTSKENLLIDKPPKAVTSKENLSKDKPPRAGTSKENLSKK